MSVAMFCLFLISVFVLSYVPGSCSAISEEYYASIRRLEECRGVHLPVKIHKMFMNYRGNNQYTITFNMSMENDITKPLFLKFDVKKCASEHGPCEDFVNHTIDNVCEELEKEGSIPRSFFSMAKLPLRCPIPKGDYSVDKNEIKVPSDLLEVGRYGNYWKLNIYIVKDNKTPIFCLYCEGKVAKSSKLKKKKKKE